MRDPERIKPIVELLERAWRANPDMRLGQLVINAARMSDRTREVDVFNAEEDAFERGLTALANRSHMVDGELSNDA
jgi:hypothetical protein